MDYLAALQHIHRTLNPFSYCEIGVRQGKSLCLADCPAIGIDPDFEVTVALRAPTRLFKTTADEFFAQQELTKLLQGPVDFAFIDGMHRVEFALRDFLNLERHTGPKSVIAIDDVLPPKMSATARVRQTRVWTGDVYRLLLVLADHRPDLEIAVYDVDQKGLAVVYQLDHSSTALPELYEVISEELAAGKWTLPSVAAIREALQPRPADRLASDLSELAAWRGNVSDDLSPKKSHYLDLLKRSVLNEIYLDNELRIQYLRDCLAGSETFRYPVLHDIRNERRHSFDRLSESRQAGQFVDRKIENCGFSHSMMGRARLENLHAALDIVRKENIPGDLVECGVWRGGGCIFMAGYLRAHGMYHRRVVVADSFDGLPASDAAADAGLDLTKESFPQLAVSLDTVRENFAAYGLGTSNVDFLQGWFKDTLEDAPNERIALLRLDGDLYSSTMDALKALYDRVVEGGPVIIDDYALEPCRQAVSDFFEARGEPLPEMETIDWTGTWFRKPRRCADQSCPVILAPRPPTLSVIICMYEMEREAPRTVKSATMPYQQGVKPEEYEVILVDNGSKQPLGVEDLPSGVRVVEMPSPHPSPVFAMNWAAREVAVGRYLLFAIDGARIFSDRIYAETLRAHRILDEAFVFTLGWHIGPDLQMISTQNGYDQETEDRLIEEAGWPESPDSLFDISVFAASAAQGYFEDATESNAFSVSRELFERVGGFDERFLSPGGGYANLEIFQRYVSRPGAKNVCLVSEATFHQVHGGVATSRQVAQSDFRGEYEAITGRPYERVSYDVLLLGRPRPRAAPFVLRSLFPAG